MALRCAPTIGPRVRRELGTAPPPLARPISRTRSYHGEHPEHAPSVPFPRTAHGGSAPGVSPAKYDPSRALPLRVSPDLRAALEALTERIPAALRLPRNTVAALALTRGLEVLGAELARDPMALHRMLAGEPRPSAPASTPSTTTSTSAPHSERAPRKPPPRPVEAPGTARELSEAAPGATEAGEAPEAPTGDVEALRERWRRSGLAVTAFAARHGINRSVLREFSNGATPRRATLARLTAALDAEGR